MLIIITNTTHNISTQNNRHYCQHVMRNTIIEVVSSHRMFCLIIRVRGSTCSTWLYQIHVNVHNEYKGHPNRIYQKFQVYIHKIHHKKKKYIYIWTEYTVSHILTQSHIKTNKQFCIFWGSLKSR